MQIQNQRLLLPGPEKRDRPLQIQNQSNVKDQVNGARLKAAATNSKPGARLDGHGSEGDAALPGYKIFLALPFCFGVNFAAGYLNDVIQDVFAHLLRCFFHRRLSRRYRRQ